MKQAIREVEKEEDVQEMLKSVINQQMQLKNHEMNLITLNNLILEKSKLSKNIEENEKIYTNELLKSSFYLKFKETTDPLIERINHVNNEITRMRSVIQNVVTRSIVHEPRFNQNEIKIVLCGSSGVGKTTFLKRVADGEFEKKYNATVGVEVKSLKLDTITGVKNDSKVKLSIWDTAGQEKYDNSRKGYYSDAHAFIVMFDYTSKNSYFAAYGYCAEIRSVNKDAPIVIVGTKCEQGHIVKLSKKKFDFGKISFCDISSKTLYGINKPFNDILKMLND